MKKHSFINCLTIFLLTFTLIATLSSCKNNEGDSRTDNDTAQKNKDKNRYLTIVNNTDQIINEVHVTVDDGREINHAYQKNPDESSFSIEIQKDYDEFDEFTVILVDRYENKYSKTVSSVPKRGVTVIEISQEEITEEPSLWKRMEMLVNKK